MPIKKLIFLSLCIGILSLISENSYSQEVILTEVDQMPNPPGGMEGFTKYFVENLKYPTKAKEDRIEGTVILTFVVDGEGKVGSIEVLRGIGGGCDEEAVRIIENSGIWEPAKKDDKIVSAKMTLPIKFKL